MSDLVQVLPALSRAHVKRLLRELADEGYIRLSGVTRSARWFIASAATPIGSSSAHAPMNEPKPNGVKPHNPL